MEITVSSWEMLQWDDVKMDLGAGELTLPSFRNPLQASPVPLPRREIPVECTFKFNRKKKTLVFVVSGQFCFLEVQIRNCLIMPRDGPHGKGFSLARASLSLLINAKLFQGWVLG